MESSVLQHWRRSWWRIGAERGGKKSQGCGKYGGRTMDCGETELRSPPLVSTSLLDRNRNLPLDVQYLHPNTGQLYSRQTPPDFC